MKLNVQGNSSLYLPRDPVSPMEAATKSYVDVGLSTHANNQDLHLTAAQNSWIDAITATIAYVNSEIADLRSTVMELQAYVMARM